MQHTFLQPFDVVLCFSHHDIALANRLRTDLHALGVPSWTGDYLWRNNDVWRSSLEAALLACGRLVVVLSEHSPLSRRVTIAVRLALKHGLAITPVWVSGDFRAAVLPSLRQLSIIDARAAAAGQAALAVPALMAVLRPPVPAPARARLLPFNPADQLRLLLWSLRRPQAVLDLQKGGDIAALRRTAGWLGATLLALYFGVELLMDALRGLRPQLLLGVVFVLGLWWLLGTQQRSGFRFSSYRWSAVLAGVGTTIIIPVALALSQLHTIPMPDIGLLLMPVFMLGVGGLSLAILETYQVRGLLLPFITFITAGGFALSTTQSLAASLVTIIGSKILTLAALTAIAASVSTLSTLLLYGLSFLLAEDMINAIYTRSKPARLAGVVLTVLPLMYLMVVLVELL